MFSNVVVKSVSSCDVLCAVQFVAQTAQHTIHTKVSNTFYHNIAEHITTYFY
jgi:hypothetical protein